MCILLFGRDVARFPPWKELKLKLYTTILKSPEINDISLWSFPQDANIGRKDWTCGYSKWVWLKIIEPWNIERLRKLTDYLLVLEFSSLGKNATPVLGWRCCRPRTLFLLIRHFWKPLNRGHMMFAYRCLVSCVAVRRWYQPPWSSMIHDKFYGVAARSEIHTFLETSRIIQNWLRYLSTFL